MTRSEASEIPAADLLSKGPKVNGGGKVCAFYVGVSSRFPLVSWLLPGQKGEKYVFITAGVPANRETFGEGKKPIKESH